MTTAAEESVRAEIAGVVLDIAVAVGDHLRDGAVVAVLESMKMEIPIIAETTGIVTSVHVDVGSAVPLDGVVITVDRIPPDV